MTLSEWQISELESRIDQSGLSIVELKEDLLDHLCCCVESDLAIGLGFETAMHNAFQQVCPNGLKEIEKETISLLNQTIYLMKKITYLSGLIASATMIIGILVKFFHWSSSTGLFVAGLLLFVFLFIPLFLLTQYKTPGNQTQKAISLAGIAGAIITGAGISFKLLHYPTADLLVLIGSAILTVAVLPVLFYNAYKKAL